MVKNTKKGSMTYDMLMHFPRFVFLFIVAFLIVLLVNMLINIDTDVRYQEAHVLYNGLFYSEEGISYKDSITGRLYPGLIDLDAFTNYTIDNLFIHKRNNFVAMKIELLPLPNVDTPEEINKIIYLNKKYYDVFDLAVKSRGTGPGGAFAIPFKRYVVVKTNNGEFPAQLNVTVLMPNE